MWIKLTQKDIDNGRTQSPWRCPIARAAARIPHKGKSITVGVSTMSVGRQMYNLPPRAKRFIIRFDAGYTVRPFSFQARKRA